MPQQQNTPQLRLSPIPVHSPAVVVDTPVVLAAMGIFAGGAAAPQRQLDSQRVLEHVFASARPVLTASTRAHLVFMGLHGDFAQVARFNQAQFIGAVCRQAQVVPVRERFNRLQDVRDNRVVEAALAGKAAQLVTYNQRLLKHREIEGVRILLPEQYLQAQRAAAAAASRRAARFAGADDEAAKAAGPLAAAAARPARLLTARQAW